MKNIDKKSFGLLVIFLLFNNYFYSQTVETPYKVGTWQGFKSAAVTYTFDDNCSNQLELAVPMFDEYDFKLTMYIVTGWGPNWTRLKNTAANGHEIGSHTVTHTSLSGLSDEEQTTELKNSHDIINSNIPEQKCVTIAYPYCNTGNNSIVQQYYFAARGCSGSIEDKTPNDFNNISSIICGSEGNVKTTSHFNTKVESAVKKKGWCVFLLHGIDNDGGYSSLSSDTLRKSLDYLKANEDRFWVATFANVAGYIKERNSVSVSETSSTEDSITVEVTDDLDNEYFNYPVTIRRPLPDGWTYAVAQNNEDLTVEVVETDSINYIMFDVIPDNGEIILTKSNTTGVEDNYQGSIPDGFLLYQNYPNPFNPSTTINYSIINSGPVTLKIYDSLGQEIETLVDKVMQPGEYRVEWNARNLPSGEYFYKLSIDDYSQTKKMVLLK
ncbi:MAG: polysaccharide deacetylase family protein [Ignavibacteria bacterium]|jgi:oligosaccharide reducing-end xylanase